jgi:hypothetical protein
MVKIWEYLFSLILQYFQRPWMLPSGVYKPSTIIVPPFPHLQVL